MARHYLIIGTLLAGLAVSVQAQGFEGAQITLETLGYSNDGDFGATSYEGGIQFGLWRNFGVEGDLAYYGNSVFGVDGRNATGHLIYGINPISNAGLFFAQDSSDGTQAGLYGIEGMAAFGGTQIEGYLGAVQGDLSDGSVFGAEGTITVGRAISLSASYDQVELEGSYNRFGIGAQYQMAVGPLLYAEAGTITGNATDDNFVALGVTLAIGPNQGTTFQPRSLFNVLQGF
ncbi:MAG: hypothetical protein NTX73_06845 [Rhodobacterales bacterium]|nr:hypothetical protein [Rhodobacterales bacterium]